MIQPDTAIGEHEFDQTLERPQVKINSATWRYMGERTAADLAYCVRFGVPQAPEPVNMHGIWAYALPA